MSHHGYHGELCTSCGAIAETHQASIKERQDDDDVTWRIQLGAAKFCISSKGYDDTCSYSHSDSPKI